MEVVNIRNFRAEVYIGRRRSGMHYGNPFVISGSMGRREVVRAYAEWLCGVRYGEVEPERRAWILDNIEGLRGKTCGCYCKPLACHGDVLKWYMEERL